MVRNELQSKQPGTIATLVPGDVERVRSPGWSRPAVAFAITTLFYWASLYVYVPILSVYAASLGASLTVVGLVVAAYGLGQLILRLPVGIASDRLGRRKPFCIAGLLAGCLGSAIMLLAPNPTWLVVGRGMAGISAAAWVTITIMFADYFAVENGARAMAFLTFLSGAAQLVATLAGGLVAETFGWSATFAISIALGAVGAALMLGVPDRRAAARRVIQFAELARVATRPHLVRIALVGTLLQFVSWATVYAFVPVYASNLGASRADLGLLTGLSLVPYTLAALGVARWAGRGNVLLIGVGGMILAAAAAASVPFIHSFALLVASQAIGGLGRGLTMPILLGLSIEEVDPTEKATAMGVFQAVYALGMFLGPASSGIIADTLGLGPAFLVSALLCLIGAGILARPLRQGVA